MSLSRGGLQAVLVEGRPACPLVLQVISAAEMRNGRFKLELSDSVHTTLGVSGSQLHELMRTVRPGSVVEVPTHTIVRVRNRMVLTVLDMRVLQQEAALMGTPVPLEDASIIAPSSNGDDAIPPHAGCTAQHSPTPSSATNNAAIVPISQLNPYMNNWTVKARVMEKSAVRCWNKTGKEGQLFTVDLKDASGDIRAVAFNAEVSRLFEQLQLHKVYKITRSRLRLADKRWNKLEHDYEICFTPQSVLTPCEDGQCADVPKQFNHRAIVKLASVSPGTMLSIICVVVSISDLHATVKSKRRIMTVGDCSNAVADVTLWGQLAEECELQPGHVAAFQSLRVSDYNGRSLTSTSATRMIPGPTDYEEETQSLREWYDTIMNVTLQSPVASYAHRTHPQVRIWWAAACRSAHYRRPRQRQEGCRAQYNCSAIGALRQPVAFHVRGSRLRDVHPAGQVVLPSVRVVCPQGCVDRFRPLDMLFLHD
eukprot:TRINITY_DN2087_c0_g1_i2.p1 TRINITY_DN2087_c0_g1~~TRINITY_DN2087_c0_g1_i2.p1  ORF type:complete len:489 (+),score=51.51 TRINITY_DN2087_c0_g1_i2:30-1469(+)